MVDLPHIRINLPDRSYQAIGRSEVKKMAESIGFDAHRLGEVEIIIAEITSNLFKHANNGGMLLVRAVTIPQKGIEIIAIDNGPGMKLPAQMMEDGHSTKKTLGQGLGAIRRLSNTFDLYSQTGWGTILLTRCFVDKNFKEPSQQSFQVSALSICKPGQMACGDAWKFTRSDTRVRLLMVDGLGHGIQAHEASRRAVETFVNLPKSMPVEQLRSMHEQLKKTRGAVINVAHVDLHNQQLVYCGVGNIAMKLVSYQQSKGCLSYNGIVGHIMPAVLNNHTLQWNNNDMVIMHSDGISSRWDIQKYPAILQYHPMILCAALYKDFDRGNDDSTILIARFNKPAGE